MQRVMRRLELGVIPESRVFCYPSRISNDYVSLAAAVVVQPKVLVNAEEVALTLGRRRTPSYPEMHLGRMWTKIHDRVSGLRGDGQQALGERYVPLCGQSATAT